MKNIYEVRHMDRDSKEESYVDKELVQRIRAADHLLGPPLPKKYPVYDQIKNLAPKG